MKYLLFILISTSLLAQENKFELSGNLHEDFLISSENLEFSSEDSLSVVFKKKTPMLAAGLSFLLPGAGQFYNEDYWKTAIFAAIEIAAITTAIIYDGKGDDQTQFYKDFANSADGWNVDKYANWSIDNANRINPELPVALDEEGNRLPELDQIYQLFDNNGNLVWSKLNTLETHIGHYYSHQLAPFDDQQYYEMIGKYQQFNPGWKDFDYHDPYTYGDPLTPTFYWYADERGKANHYYDVASTAVIVVIANHVLSAVEAALAANSYNRSLTANVSIQSKQIGYNKDYFPQLNLSYNF
ncbi:MAG: DUF5683 domain-containing protein [Bacteroidota bacterium]